LAPLFFSATHFFASHTRADDEAEAIVERAAAQQFEQLSQWEGCWAVDETDRLSIVFEPTASGSVIVER